MAKAPIYVVEVEVETVYLRLLDDAKQLSKYTYHPAAKGDLEDTQALIAALESGDESNKTMLKIYHQLRLNAITIEYHIDRAARARIRYSGYLADKRHYGLL